MSPKVSIIIPTYNRVRYLREALDSALSQTYPNIEIIVVDDGSTDNTEQVVARYGKHLCYIKQENAGCAAAKNTGLAHASGVLLTNLDDDDRIHPEKIARQVAQFEANPALGICGTGVNFIDKDGNLIEPYMPPRFSRDTQVLQLLRRCFLVQPSVMIHRKVHDHLGGYKLMLSEDYEFWLRAALHYDIGVVEDYLTDYRQHGKQITGPQTRPALMQAVEGLIQDFVERTPIAQIIQQLRVETYGYALIGVLLCEQKLFELAETYFERVLPDVAGTFGFGTAKFLQKDLSGAKSDFERVSTQSSPLQAKATEALRLIARTQSVLAEPEICNTSPEVESLRREVSGFYAGVIGTLLSLSRGL
jgi:teichuronic acid biosynthesis glycosyltransferase TuaG